MTAHFAAALRALEGGVLVRTPGGPGSCCIGLRPRRNNRDCVRASRTVGQGVAADLNADLSINACVPARMSFILPHSLKLKASS